MADQKGFVRLNHEQKRVLKALKVLDGHEGGFREVSENGIGRISAVRVMPALYELSEMGYVVITNDEHGPSYINLSTWTYCYRREYFMNLVVPAFLQMLGGVSGGLVVWCLGRLFQ